MPRPKNVVLLDAHDDEPEAAAVASNGHARRSRHRKPYQRLVYTEPDWQREEPSEDYPEGKPSALIFRGGKTDRDDQLIEQAMQRWTISDYDPEELAAHTRGGGDPNEFLARYAHPELMMTLRRAYLAHQIVAWSGPEFVLPDDYEDETAEPITDEVTGQPMTDAETGRLIYPISEFAGQIPPPTAEWLNVTFDGEETTRIWRWLQGKYAGGGAEAEATFPGRRPGLARS